MDAISMRRAATLCLSDSNSMSFSTFGDLPAVWVQQWSFVAKPSQWQSRKTQSPQQQLSSCSTQIVMELNSSHISGCTGFFLNQQSISHTWCWLNRLPDFSVFIICCRGLNLQLDELSGERSGNDGGRLHVTWFYGLRQVHASLL